MRMKIKTILFLSVVAILSVAGSPSVFTQPLFWQPTHLDSISVKRLATNERGDIFASYLFCCIRNLYRSTNDGDTWDTLDIGDPRPSILSLLTGPHDEVFAGTATGVYYSSDNGDHWEKRSSLQAWALATPDSGRSILAGAGGVYRSLDTC